MLALGVDRHLDHRRDVGDEAVVRRQPQALPFGILRPQPRLLRDALDHPAQAPGVDRIALGRFAVVPGVADLASGRSAGPARAARAGSRGGPCPAPARSRRRTTAPRTRAGCCSPSATSRCACAPSPPGSRCACSGSRTACPIRPSPSSNGASVLRVGREDRDDRRLGRAVQPGRRPCRWRRGRPPGAAPRRCGSSRGAGRPRASR